MKNLPVNSLNFEDIKDNLKTFLKGNELYKDFNFEASGISTLINILSYQTHYIGYFVKMLLDEAFVDSAHTRQALLSHAKRNSYIPRGKKAAAAEVILRVVTTIANEPASRSIEIRRGDKFNSSNNTQDNRVFNVLDGSIAYNRQVDGDVVTYVSDNLRIYEGTLRTWNFVVDTSVVNQKFVIRDANADIDTLRVRVRENDTSTQYTEYMLASDIMDLERNSNAYFISTDEAGYYQIFFGGNVFGTQPDNGNAIEVTYVSTNGETGDGARQFRFVSSIPTSYTYETEVTSISGGGAEPQTIEELRFAIPNHIRRQNRILTESDARGVLLENFRNIDSINIWGGEKNEERDYGKLFVSIKPKFSDRLTALNKTQIRDDIIRKHGFVGIDVVFLDPDFINVDMTIAVSLDMRKTNKSQPEVFNDIQAKVNEYNVTFLSKFDNILSDLALLNFIKANNPAVSSIFTRKTLFKNHGHLHQSTSTNNVRFGNELAPRSIVSSEIKYGLQMVVLKDNGFGNISLYNGDVIILPNIGSVNYNTGSIFYTLPANTRIAGFETSQIGTLKISAVPVVPDIMTSMNNIVRIASTKVVNA